MPYGDYQKEQYLEKPLPSSPESERVVLGAVLLDNQIVAAAAESLTPEDFYSPFHRRVYKAMIDLFERGDVIEPIQIGEELKNEGQLEAIGGIAAITNITYGLPHFSNVDNQIKIIRDKASIRNLIRAHREGVSFALSEDDTAENILNHSEQLIFSACDRAEESRPEMIGSLVFNALQKTKDIQSGKLKVPGLPTGFTEIDAITGGLRRQDLIIVAARPSMGKTSLCLNIAQKAAILEGAVVAVFSLEMSKEQLGYRMLSSEAKVDLSRLTQAYLTREENEKADQAAEEISKAKLIIDDTPGLSPIQMLSKCRRIKAEHKKLDLILVDYLQLMNGSKRTESRQQEVAQNARELKTIAKTLDVPLIALSQLSRAPEARNPPKPMMSDLRESGEIEQTADVVAFIYREDYYKPSEENAGVAEILFAKQRNGPTGTVRLAFLKEFTRFENAYFEESYSSQPPPKTWTEPVQNKFDDDLDDDPRFK